MLTSLAKSVERFFAWWGGELAACLPEALRARIGSKRRRLVITLGPDRASFARAKGEQLEPLGEVALSPDDPAAELSQVRDVMRALKSKITEVTLRLGAGQALARRVVLPAAAEDNLREVLGFEMDRNTPFKADEVLYDARVAARDTELKTVAVDLVVVARDTAQQAIARLGAWDLEPDRLDPGVSDAAGKGFNLLTRPSRAGSGKLRRRVSLAAGLAAIGLAAVVVTVPLIKKQEQLEALEARLAAVRGEALRADQLKQEVQGALARSRFMVELKQTRAPTIELLDEITKELPDNTWLLHFAYRGNRVNLAGYSAKPTDLIGLLERSDLLEEVAFTSPVTMDLRVGRERFNLSARVEAEREP
ncbi:MAG: PilN domain-containing protein [Pseudomonadota bacterium]